MNTTDNTNVVELDNHSFMKLEGHQNNTTHYFVAVWYLIVSSVGLALIISVLIAIVKLHPGKMPPFFLIVTNLCITDALTFLLYIFYVIPCVFTQRQPYGIIYGFSVMGFVEASLFMTVISCSFLISCNRFLRVCFKNVHDKLFTRNLSIFMTSTTWAFAFSATLFNVLVGCKTIFNERQYTFATNCAYIPSYLSVESFVVYTFVYGVAFCYVFALLKIWKQKTEVNASNGQITTNLKNRQMKFFYQAFCIWLSLLTNAIGFRILPSLSLSGLPAAVCSTILVMCPSYVTSICLLLFSSDLRKKCLCCRTSTTAH